MRAVNRGNGGKTALHRRVRILAVATAVVVPIALSGCGSDSSQVTAGSSGGTQRGAEPGYLVPTDWYTVAGKGPYEVKASVKDGTFTATLFLDPPSGAAVTYALSDDANSDISDGFQRTFVA